MAHHQLDELDEKILKLIIGNARMPFLEVARECKYRVQHTPTYTKTYQFGRNQRIRIYRRQHKSRL